MVKAVIIMAMVKILQHYCEEGNKMTIIPYG